MLSHFHTIPACYGQTDRIAISILRVSVLTRNKNRTFYQTARAQKLNKWHRLVILAN